MSNSPNPNPEGNPYAAPATALETPTFSKAYKIRWGRSYPALKGAHWILVVLGFFQLCMSLIPAARFDDAVAQAVKQEIVEKEMRRVDEKTRMRMKEEKEPQLKLKLIFRGTIGLTLLLAGLLIFHFPIPSSIIATIVYAIQFALSIIMVVFAGVATFIVSVGILIVLISAVISAFRFEKSYEQDCANRLRKAKTAIP
jgi:hypothetical protein